MRSPQSQPWSLFVNDTRHLRARAAWPPRARFDDDPEALLGDRLGRPPRPITGLDRGVALGAVVAGDAAVETVGDADGAADLLVEGELGYRSQMVSILPMARYAFCLRGRGR